MYVYAMIGRLDYVSVCYDFSNVCFQQAHNNLVSLLEQADIKVKSVAFVNDPEPAIKELKVTRHSRRERA